VPAPTALRKLRRRVLRSSSQLRFRSMMFFAFISG
jgi:hypothetical protein